MYIPHKHVAILRVKVTHLTLAAISATTLICLSSLFALAQPDAPAGQKMTLDSLMKHHLDALGGRVAVKNIKTIRMTGTVKEEGHTGAMIETEKLPYKQNLKITQNFKITTKSFTTESAYDGNTGWTLDPTGQLSHDNDTDTNARYDLYLASHVYALGGPTRGKVTLRSEREAGTGAYIVDIVADGFPASTFYFDPQTYLITKSKDHDSVTSFSGYKKFGGVMFPTVEKDAGTDGSAIQTYTITKVDTNIPVDDSLFEPPKRAAPDQLMQPVSPDQF